MDQKTLEKNKQKLSNTLDRVLEMEVGISDNSEDYTLEYIAAKLALVTAYSEKLSTYSTLLASHSLAVINGARSAKSYVKIRTAQIMLSPEYQAKSGSRQKAWLEVKIAPLTISATNWEIFEKSLNVVQDAIAEKMTTFRKIDSSLRLQTRIYEDQHGMGYGVPAVPGEKAVAALPCEDLN